MLKHTLLLVIVLTVFETNHSMAQTVCNGHPNSLYCLPNSFFGKSVSNTSNPFTPWGPTFSAVGSQLSLLPLPSPASGILLTFNTSLGVYSRASESLGPILNERAETIGRHKLFLAFDYQRFGFDSIDGIDLKRFPLVFQACDQPFTNNNTVCPGNLTVAATTDRIDLKIDQFTAFATFGLSDRVDVSVAVPVLQAKLGMGLETRTILRGSPTALQPGSSAGSASGIGDVVARGKGTLLKGERFGLAAGVDLRFPTGNELDFLGSGAWGVKPFLSASYRAKVSPHVEVGYQWNGDSTLANPFGEGGALGGQQLPTNFFFAAGADIAATKRLTIALDFLSSRVFDALRLSRAEPFGYDSVLPTQSSFTTSDGAIGVKINPIANLLITANVTVKLDHYGLRHKPIPLLGLSYIF